LAVSCFRYKVDLSAIVDRELDTKSLSEVQRHLHSCRDCSVDLARLRDFDDFLVAQLSTVSQPSVENGLSFFDQLRSKLPGICSLNQQEFSAYLDGELTGAAQEGVTSHLHSCSKCLKQFSSLNAVNQLVVRGVELPGSHRVDLWNSIKEQLNENCAHISTELSAFMDQEVPRLRHRHIAVHLSECSHCNSSFQTLSQISDLIKENYIPVIATDFNLLTPIKAKLNAAELSDQADGKSKSTRKFYLVAWSVAVFIVLLGSVLFLFLFNRTTLSVVSAEDFLIQTALEEPSESAEVVLYEE
jgi:anti-sigma factor RsiW